MAWYILLFIKWIAEKYGMIKYNDSMSVQYIRLVSRNRMFDCTATQKQIGYSPVISREEGVTLTIESFSNLARNSSFPTFRNFNEESKVEKVVFRCSIFNLILHGPMVIRNLVPSLTSTDEKGLK